MIAGAEDAVTCSLVARYNQTLMLHVDANELLPETYRASVWASHSGDEVLRREVPVALGQTVIEFVSDIDHIGFAIFRAADGQCVDLMEVSLTMEVSIRLELESGPTLHLRNRQSPTIHTVNPSGSVSMINVQSDQESAELDKGIRRQWLDRQIYEREAAARRDGNLASFEPDQVDQAVSYFIDLLRQSAHTGPIYLADRHFMRRLNGDEGTQLYLDLFAATTGRSLCILCTQQENGDTQPWWSSFPSQLTSHISVRAFLKKDTQRPGFHDRYLSTPERDTLITNSFNGWRSGEVTFVSLPYGVFRSKAEYLWSMEVDSTAAPLLVREIC